MNINFYKLFVIQMSLRTLRGVRKLSDNSSVTVVKYAIFDISKFKLGSEAWGNKTKEIASRLRDERLIYFVLFHLDSEPC